MKNYDIDTFGSFYLPAEFEAFSGEIDNIDVCSVRESPSEILAKLADGRALLLTGEYRYANAVYWYCQRNENKLIKEGEIELDDYYKRHALQTQIKRKKLHRLFFAANNDDLMFISESPLSKGLQKWCVKESLENPFLIPLRRYQRILTDMERARDGIYFNIIDAKIIIKPFVYVPTDLSIPAMFLLYKTIFTGKKVLDIGTGTGILALLAAKMNATSVIATDINPYAVDCARTNASITGLDIIIKVADPGTLFEPINQDERFDIIMFNAPWIKGKPRNLYDYALYDNNYEVINKFLSNAARYLYDDGFILLQYSDISQMKGEHSMDNLYAALEDSNLVIASQNSIIRKSRVLGAMERVYLFEIKIKS